MMIIILYLVFISTFRDSIKCVEFVKIRRLLSVATITNADNSGYRIYEYVSSR